MLPRTGLLIVSLACVPAVAVRGAEALVAVAASFVPPMQAIVSAFEEETSHSVTLVSGSTGALYAQIVNGAPFDLFVAADAERPRLLEAGGHGVPGTRATVALGRLVLYARDAALLEPRGLEALESGLVRHVAIANPRVAPYGVAARETLQALGLWEQLEPRLVRGESVAQTYAMIATGNAELGFVALAQVVGPDRVGAYVIVPESQYAPIRQDVILLTRAQANAAATELRAFLLGPRAQAIVARHGYASPAP